MKKAFTLTLLLITCICLVFDAHNRWKGTNWNATVNADGYGYYAYLPCIFVLHSFDYKKIIAEERQLRPDVSYEDAQTCFPVFNGTLTDKFFAGESVLLLPFFLIAYFLASILGYDTNGYSLPFQIGVSIGALFYLLLGLIFLRKLLKEYQFSESIILVTVLLMVSGTNLLYYATIEPSMSHIYCFSLVAVFLYYIKRCCTDFSVQAIAITASVFSLLIIIRPTNINALALVPFIAGDFTSLKTFLENVLKPKTFLVLIAASIPVLMIQGIIWKIETGHFIYWSYQGEKFYFDSPEFVKFLFSFRNGWFVYTPLMLLTIIGGLLILLQKSFYQFITFLLFIVFAVYLLSSWYAWYYGGFGKRAMIDYYAGIAILLALCLNCLNKNNLLRVLTAVISGVLIFVNITQTRQYINSILMNEYMNKERYLKIFMKTDSKYVGIFEHKPPAGFKFFDSPVYENGFEDNAWGNNNSITDEYAHNSRHSAFIGEKINFSPVLSVKVSALPQQPNLFAYVQASVYMADSSSDARLVLSLQIKDGKVYSSYTAQLKDSIPYFSDWEQLNRIIAMPPFRNNDDSIKIYFEATKGKTYIDEEKITFCVKK
ncbi:MAG: hypothetical protein ACLQQ4_10570 [Bacteroidia bacterium]